MVGLIEVLGAEHDVGAGAAHGVHGVPHLIAAAGVEPGRRLVEQEQAGRADEARPEVEPAAHPAGIGPDAAVGGLDQIHLFDDARRALLGRLGRLAVEPGDHDEVLAPRHHLLDSGRLAGQADHAAHGHRVAHDVVPVDAQRAAVGLDQRGDHADERGLPRTVGPEDRHRLARRQGEAQSGERLDLAELLGEAVGLDERVHRRASFRSCAAACGSCAAVCCCVPLGPARRRSPTLWSCCLGRRSLVDRARGCLGPGPRVSRTRLRVVIPWGARS